MGLAVTASVCAAQSKQNIAGSYRGLMTGCLSIERSGDCRKGFVELIRLADAVDARRMDMERVASAEDPSMPGMKQKYEQAIEELNRAVVDFNRDMNSAPSGSK